MKWYLAVLKKYAVFSGRARRKEFWIYGLIHTAIIFTLHGIEFLVVRRNPDTYFVLVSFLYVAATLVPTIAVSVRRLHDTNLSGWWYLFMFVPIIGVIVMTFDFAEDSQRGDNRYGPNPKGDLPAIDPFEI